MKEGAKLNIESLGKVKRVIKVVLLWCVAWVLISLGIEDQSVVLN